jgi:predicted AAA+ superfamily ATPase
VDPSGIPLGVRASAKIFKALMVDIGLMRYLSGMPVDVEYSKANLLDIYRGAMAEQFVGQELLLSQREGLYYWSRRAKSSSAEVDYVGVMDGKVHPLEVKSGSPGRLKSLHLFLKTYNKSPQGIVFSVRPYEEVPEKNLTYIPLYQAFAATGGKENL